MHIIFFCMKKARILSRILSVICLFLSVSPLFSQTSSYSVHFLDYQKSFPRISEMMNREEDTLKKQFQAKQLVWPARYVYIRSFKYDSEMEVWVKNRQNEKYKLFKTYRICALAGSLGPKRMAGDYQVPEGFYYINEFNPRSLYHLSLGLNYPNASDKMLCDLSQPGGDIYIHGSCVTTGCIPITDGQIEELYVLAAHAKDMGQDFIPVHIFPVNFNKERSVAYLSKFLVKFQ
jgi:murein L,D-transpeptidase YafK